MKAGKGKDLKLVIQEMDASSDGGSPDASKKKNYSREWNTVDFVGKYHLSKFANKDTPLPGTQVQIERDYKQGQIEKVKEREAYLAERARRTNEMLRVKSESAEMNTRIYFDTIVGQPIQQAEDILNEREDILNHVDVTLDTAKDIDRFIKNVTLDRHHYVGFAASAGFRSINYAEPVYGNTPLHLAVKKGLVATVEELLKYKADMDVQNRLGNRPIHECWFFWQTHANRTKEQRLAQEQTTCELLLKLLSYGACVDSQDQQGQTALHIACRLGPLRAVKIILSFQANLTLKTRAGLTAAEVAAHHGQEEIFKLITAWSHIAHTLVHVDFHHIWHRFLCDYSQIISTHKSAAAILAEIDMSNSVRHMERSGNEGAVQIDDPLLRAAYEASKTVKPPPKPWEVTDWAAFVKEKQNEGTMNLKMQLENLQRQMQGYKAKKLVVNKTTNAVHKPSTSPDKPTPPPKPRRLQALPPGALAQNTETVVKDALEGRGAYAVAVAQAAGHHHSSHTGATVHNHTAPPAHTTVTANRVGGNHATTTTTTSTAKTGKISTATSSAHNSTDHSSDSDSESNHGESEKYIVKRTDYGQIQDFSASQLGQRRLHLAHKVALDAKFLTFTKRQTMNSALLLPLRTPHAPHQGTEEEGDRMRAIVSQGPDYEKFEKYKKTDKFAEMLGIRPEPKKNVLGAYSEECEFSKPNDRDALYEQLQLTNAEKIAAMGLTAGLAGSGVSREGSRAGSRASSRPGTANSSRSRPGTSSLLGGMNRNVKTILEVEKRSKIDLVKDRRPRYVDAELLPSVRPPSLVEQMSREEAKRQETLLRKKQGLGTEHGVDAARKQMEATIAAQGAGIDLDAAGAEDGMEKSAMKRKLDAEKAVAMRKLFLHKEVPQYGEGRITSTHNTKGKLEEPWVTTKGRYTTLEGDRTA